MSSRGPPLDCPTPLVSSLGDRVFSRFRDVEIGTLHGPTSGSNPEGLILTQVRRPDASGPETGTFTPSDVSGVIPHPPPPLWVQSPCFSSWVSSGTRGGPRTGRLPGTISHRTLIREESGSRTGGTRSPVPCVDTGGPRTPGGP